MSDDIMNMRSLVEHNAAAGSLREVIALAAEKLIVLFSFIGEGANSECLVLVKCPAADSPSAAR